MRSHQPFRIYCLCVLFFCQLSCKVCAQKVALVLSGGGAKGIAYIGAIRALEEKNIPIDYVIGTSMGGIIAAFYAAGYTPDEMEAIVTSADFAKWLSGGYDDAHHYHIFEPDADPSLLKLKIGLEGSFSLDTQTGLINDKSLNWILSELLDPAAAAAHYDFDSLMVPMRCVAADLYSQQALILKEGSLSNAARVTMGLPLIFPPYQLEDRYLFDGGIYSNFPTQEARRIFKPDYIIGINVGDLDTDQRYPYEKEDEYLSGILWRLLMNNTDTTGLYPGGMYLAPDLQGISAADFGEASRLIEIGYQAIQDSMSILLEKIQRRETTAQLAQRRERFKAKLPPLEFSKPTLGRLDRAELRNYPKRVFRFKNQSLDLENLKSNYYALAQTGHYGEMQPNFIYHDSLQKYQLDLELLSKPSLTVGVGGNLASRNINHLFLSLAYSFDLDWYYRLQASIHSGTFNQSFRFSGRVYLPFQRRIYFEPGMQIIRRNYQLTTEFLSFFNEEITSLSQREIRVFLNTAFEISPSLKAWLSNSLFRSEDDFITGDEIGTSVLEDPSRSITRAWRLGLGLGQNLLNRKSLASQGKAWRLEGAYFAGEESYRPGELDQLLERNRAEQNHQWFQARFQYEQYFNFGKYHPGFLVNAFYSDRPRFQHITSDLTNSPSFNPFLDSETFFLEDFRSRQFVAWGLRQVYSFTTHLDLRLEGYLFHNFEPLGETDDLRPVARDGNQTVPVAAASLAYHTILGPLSLTASYYGGGTFQKERWLFLLNIGHLIFPQRALDH